MAGKKPHRARRLKKRLDLVLVEKGLIRSRQRAKAMIMAGKVYVDDMPCDKPGSLVNPDARFLVKEDDHPYVSRGGLKLEKALKEFPVDVGGKTCLDIGASTGGFTDCLLQFGAQKVYAVDVGYGQLAWSLRQDDRVKVIERTNIRHMDFDCLGETVDIVTADTSFISLKTVLPAAEQFMGKGAEVIALIKPQFEAGKEHIGKGGVVRDPVIRERVVRDVAGFFTDRGYGVRGVSPSPILGPKGNEEYLLFMDYSGKT